MKPFTESNDVLNNPSAVRKRLRDDGYLFLRDVLPRDDVVQLRRQILEICEEAGWLRPRANLMDGLTDHAPIEEGSDAHAAVYKKVQALESFHRLKLHANVMKLFEDIYEEPAIAFPQTIGRIAFPRDDENQTQPHQDWIFVGGSTETISCWAPLGDIPIEVGGLKILEGSHKAGFLEPRVAAGPGHRSVDIDPDLEWVQSGYRAGDLLLFKMLTIHAAANNRSPDRLRLSMDFRYTGESHVIGDEWLIPHSCTAGWEELESEWRDSPTAHYWDRLPKMKIRSHPWWWDQAQIGRPKRQE